MGTNTPAHPYVHDGNPTLTAPYASGGLHNVSDYYNSNSQGRIRRTLDVYNSSSIAISAMFSDGLTGSYDAEPRCFRNEATVIVTYEFSGGATPNWAAFSKNLPHPDQTFIEQVKNAYDHTFKVGSYAPAKIEFYFVIDISDIEYRPNGIYVKAIDLQLVATRFVNVAVPYRRQAQLGVADFLDDERVPQAAACLAAYVVHDPSDHEVLFMASPTGLIVLDPWHTTDLPEGVHVISVGGRRSPGDQRVSEIEHIPIADFGKRYCFRGLDNFKNNFDRNSKPLAKTDIDRIYARMTEFLNRNQTPPETSHKRTPLVERPIFFGESLKDVVASLQELGKLKTAVEKLI